MKQNLKVLVIVGASLLFGGYAFSQQAKSSQLQCRTKAKETAKAVYDECLNLAKYDEAENIRKEYKAKLSKLKAFYEQKLKKLNLKAKSEVKNSGQTSEMASTLPQKEVPVANSESPKGSYSAPAPTNIQENEVASAPNTVPSNTIDSSSQENSEPSIRLKPAPAPNQMDTPAEPLDSAPDLTI